MNKLLGIIILLGCGLIGLSQQIPTKESNIDYIVTYGKDASKQFGDDDNSQVFFITVPVSFVSKFYIRIFSPGANTSLDVSNGVFDSSFEYSIYGGDSVLNEASKNVNPIAGYDEGVLLESELFDKDADTGWVSMGPFNPKDGGGFLNSSGNKQRIFKIICKGIKGDDGNLYRLFVSTQRDINKTVSGGNSFTYEYSFRMKKGKGTQCYLFPFIDGYTKAIKQYNFDYDGDGSIRLYTIDKKGLLLSTSGNGEWATNTIEVSKNERNKTGEIVFVKKGHWHNDITFYLLNQYEKSVPFYTLPIGNRPAKNKKITVTYK